MTHAIWLTGLSGAGKTTIADALEIKLKEKQIPLEKFDGDMIRQHLTKGLGFSKEDRDENIRRIGFVSNLLVKYGVFTIVSAISPYGQIRDEVRASHNNKFIEVHVAAPLETCEQRDVKGLYAKARSGEIKNFTGISDPYEAPMNPEITCNTNLETVDQSVQKILTYLEQKELL